MELRTLRYFVAVAEALNFTRAAEQLHMSQPPLSQQIRALEQELCVELLIRNSHKVELTEAGAVLLQEAKRILAITEQAKHKVQQVASGEAGLLNIGFLGSLTYEFLPRVLRLYRSRYPNVQLIMHEMGIAAQMQAVAEGIIQVAFVGPVDLKRTPHLASTCLVQDPLVVALPVDHSLVLKSSVRLRSLSTESFVMLSHQGNPEFYELIIRLCHSAKFIPNIVQETDRAQTLLTFVAAGFGIGIIPSRAQLLPIDGVVYKPLSDRRAMMELSIVWQINYQSAVVQQFLEVVQKIINETELCSSMLSS